MQQYNEDAFHQQDKTPSTETRTDIGTWILICIILALINVILGLL